MHSVAIWALFVLQVFHVLFLALHDWIPLGSLNDLRAVHAENSRSKLIADTLMGAAPFAFGLVASTVHLGQPLPAWLFDYLGISYVLLFMGELQAWWIPYFFRSDPARAARYQTMFGNTHAFLPERNGIRPNTLHIILHVATLATLAVLAVIAVL